MLPDLEMGSGVAGRPGSDGRKDDGGGGFTASPGAWRRQFDQARAGEARR
jgi:hypothetical protein